MAILICGGAGYVGSHMVAELLEQGHETVVVDNLEKGHKAAVGKEARFYQGDLRDSLLMDKVFTENKISSVVNYAAYSLVGESVSEPMKYYENNVVGALSLLKSMLKHDVRNIVFSSTAAVYGEPSAIPITEDSPTLPVNPYGETKLTVEKILKWYEQTYNLSYATLRYFNVAGAHCSGEIGEDHTPETHLIPIILQTAMGKFSSLPLYGNDYDTPDGTCIRDYIHVTDLADAHILALKKLESGSPSLTYNLGSGNGFSNKEIIDTACHVTGRKIPIEQKGRRSGDPAVLIASSEKIKQELGWNPVRTDLETIIDSAWQWHSKYPEGFKNA
ncbi:MAG: UDP-glucose 4-epimerase GalE [Defluviitaleaceae bacterium]|nr:UDP-glucose 4-epimerase GalE [Defluviitaleaceae bacterium]